MAKTTNQQFTLRATGMLQAGRDIAYNQLITALDSFLQRVNTNVWNVPGNSTGGANVAYIEFDDSAGTRKGFVGDANGGADSAIYLGADAGEVILYSQGAARCQVGTVALAPMTDGGFDLGTAGLQWNELYVQNIVFPATQVASAGANTLDDYEEGTFTPTLTFATPGNLTVVYGTRIGNYTKIGRAVKISCLVETTTFTHTTAAGQLFITGLPFTDNVTTPAFVALTAGFTTGADTQISALTFGTQFQFYYTNNATGGLAGLLVAQAPTAANKLMYVGGFYNA